MPHHDIYLSNSANVVSNTTDRDVHQNKTANQILSLVLCHFRLTTLIFASHLCYCEPKGLSGESGRWKNSKYTGNC